MTIAWIITGLLVYPAMAHAYVGPGAAIGLLGSVIGFLTLIAVILALTLAWPLKKLLKKWKQKKAPPVNSPEASDHSEAP